MSGTNTRLSNLSPEKRKLLERRLLEKRLAAKGGEQIPRRNHDGPAPLSFAQELLWLLDRISPGTNAAYNVPRAIRITGPLDVGAMESALNQILERHEVLRTTIRVIDGVPVQVVSPHRHSELRVEDCSDQPEAERENAVQRLLVQEARHQFDLSRDLMLRSRLYKMAEQDHLLLLISHHIASDGWSRGLIFRELMELYRANTENRSPELPSLPIQYADFAEWQREALRGEAYQARLDYWKRQLTGAPNFLQLPADRPHPPVQTFRGARQTMLFSKSLLEALKALGRAEGATLFMVLLAAFKVLLYRYTAQPDLVVGTPIAGRERTELEPLIGYFSNTLALRTNLSGNPTFRELVRRVREVSLDAFANQDVPFEKLVVELHPERDLRYTPVFQVMFSVGTAPTSDLQVPGLILTPLRTDRGSSKFDLTLGLTEGPEALTGSFEYNTDIFDKRTIVLMVAHFENLLHEVVKAPDSFIDSISLLSQKELRETLIDRNQTARTFSNTGSLHELFERQVERSPDAVAVSIGESSLTYRQLSEHANRVANALRSRGVDQNVPVGVCLGRSLELPVALLGVLKAGAACVPLDPSYPQERLAFMVKDSQQQVLITRGGLLSILPKDRPDLLLIDLESPDFRSLSAELGNRASNVQDLAYLIYTSGSTGTPRGVMLTHEGLVNHSLAAVELYGLSASDRVLQFSSISFDIAIEEIYPTLICGGAVVLRPEDMPLSGKRFLRWLDENRITVLDLPTAFWHQWVTELESLGSPLPTPLRLVIVGGEKASARAYRSFRRIAGPALRWVNTYGPTEASVIVTAYEPREKDAASDAELPIGSPIPNTAVYIVDANQNPLPAGVAGELLIGGSGLARGYWNQPELTAKKFVSLPMPDGTFKRVYKTGDLGRWPADQPLEFIGRTDFQVKIRGFRVEPGEIETALMAHPEVQEAVVVACQQGSSEKRLVAYVVCTSSGMDPSVLRKTLQDKLPEYMVPATFIQLDKLPLTANGKVDRTALPSPNSAEFNAVPAYAVPRDPLEIQLTKIWESVLGLPKVGVRDNFFDLGGHSLLAIRIIDQIEKECGRALPLASLFAAPTIEQLADVILSCDSGSSDSVMVEVQSGGQLLPFFFFHGDLSGGGLYCRGLARALGQERPFFALQPLGSDGKDAPVDMEEMIQTYVQKIRQVHPQGPYLLGGFCNGGMLALEVAHQLRKGGEQVGALLLVDAWPSNVGLGWAKSAIELCASLLGLDREKQLSAFLDFRAFLVRLRKTVRWKLLSSYLRRKWMHTRSRAHAVLNADVKPLSEPDPKLWFARNRTFGADMERRIRNSDRYRQALKTYIPSRFSGRLTSFCPSEGQGKHVATFRRVWKQLAPEAEIVLVPGDHLSCITDRVEELACLFRQRLAV